MDFYEILQVPSNASQDDIKKSYQQLILRHHPDKNADKEEENLHMFLKIDDAYKILKDPIMRKEYDSKQFQETSRCQMIIHDTVNRTDFVYDQTNEVHYHVCKCGGWYILDEDESSVEEEYIICCDECSLVIKVVNKKRT